MTLPYLMRGLSLQFFCSNWHGPIRVKNFNFSFTCREIVPSTVNQDVKWHKNKKSLEQYLPANRPEKCMDKAFYFFKKIINE
jgi:hypothetical protein